MLSIEICKMALEKSSLKGILVDLSEVSKKIMINDRRENPDGGPEQVYEILSSRVGIEFPVENRNENLI